MGWLGKCKGNLLKGAAAAIERGGGGGGVDQTGNLVNIRHRTEPSAVAVHILDRTILTAAACGRPVGGLGQIQA